MLRTNEGNEVGLTAYRDTDAAYVYAVDDGSVYWHDAGGAVRYDVAAGTSTRLGDAGPFTIGDVANEMIAYQPPIEGQDDDNSLFRVGRTLESGQVIPHRGNVTLSPDGKLIAFEDGDELFVNRTDTAADLTPKLDGYSFYVVYQWYDDDTAGVFGITHTGPNERSFDVDFLSCEIPSGKCAKELSTSIDPNRFAFPVGEYIGD